MDSHLRQGLELARAAIRPGPDACDLTQLAEIAGISPFHFHRLYSKTYGETPHGTLTRVRLQAAIRALRDEGTNINEICIDLGFSSHTTFTAWFQARSGLSPTAYRAICRKAQEPRITEFRCDSIINFAMDISITHVTVFVTSQASALDFYTQKLGFEVASDVTLPEGFRWLTVAPQAGGPELVLFPIGEQVGMSPELVGALRTVLSSGYAGPCIFRVPDLDVTHAELTSKDVKVQQEPHEEMYGKQAIYLDDSGNALTFVQG